MRAYEFIREDAAAVGKIATEKERNDPRYKTSLTVDVKPDTMKRLLRPIFPQIHWIIDRNKYTRTAMIR